MKNQLRRGFLGAVLAMLAHGRLFGFLTLLGALALADVGTSVAQQPSARFNDLKEHILGSDTMTVAELQSWATTFASEAGTLGDRIDDFLAAVEVVDLYEDEVGPLFTSAGQSSFNNSWNGETNLGRALGRTMLGVYQSVFDAFDNDLVSQNAQFVFGVKFRSTENFPGSVPNPSATTYDIQIDGTLHEEFGSDGGYNTNAARRMTGAYLAPGTIALVTVPNALVNAGFKIRVGGHSWDLSNKNTANRLHRVSNLFDITDSVVLVANPMGGNIYIEVPVGADAGIVDIQFSNTIRAPFFSNRSFDKTTKNEWESVERHHPGAFTDIESEHSMWTVPSKWVRALGYDQLMEIIDAHDANIQVASEYAGKNADRHKAILYMIVDTQIRANAFSIGYPQSNYGSFNQNSIRAPLTLANAFDKVLWHEHGHAELVTMFSGETESLVHMVAVTIGMENYGMTVQEAFAESLAYGSHSHTTSDTLSSWVVMDEFINNNGMAFQQGSYRPRGHADYVEYVEMFGLQALQNFNHRINIEMDGLDWDTGWANGRNNHNANDRILRLSREAGVNVAPLFHLWGHRPSNLASLTTSMAAEGLGESVQIYDRMIEARDSVPMSQAQWNAVDNVMKNFLNESRGPWQALRTNYDLVRAQDAVGQVQFLIDLYFPNGRPADLATSTQLVFEATTANTTLYNNEVSGTAANLVLSGATPDLSLVNDGGDFFYGGFASTDNIDTLNGTPLLDTETVTVKFVVDSVTSTDASQLRSRGIELGLSADTTAAGGGSLENLTLRIGGGGNSGNVDLVNNTDGIPYTITSSPLWDATPESVLDGFGVTLVANTAGFTFSFTGLEAEAGQFVAGYTGTWASPGDFLTNVGGGHLYAAVQKRLAGSTAMDISVASISVTSPVDDALLGDVDLNGAVDFADIPAFIAVLQSSTFQAEADCDENGTIDFADIPAFIAILQGN